MNSCKELKVWEQAMELAVDCYELTKPLPREGTYGMTSQIRRCSSSIPANIAEGWGRQSTGDYIRFLPIAQGSLKELETHLILCDRVGLMEASSLPKLESQTQSIGKMLFALIRSLQKKQAS